MSSSPKKRPPKHAASATAPSRTHSAARARDAAIALACFGTPTIIALWNTGNRFGPVKASVLAFAAALAVAALALDPDTLPRLRALIARSWITLGALALLAVAIIAAVFGRAPGAGIFGTYSDFRGVAMLAACVGVFLATAVTAGAAPRTELLARLWWPLHVSTAVVLTGAVLQRFEVLPGAFSIVGTVPRVFSTAGNSSNLGVLLVLVLPLLVASALGSRPGWQRRVSWALIAVALPVLLWTSSRGAVLGAGAALVVWAVLERTRLAHAFRDRRVLAAVAGAGVLVVAVVALTPGTAERLGSLLDTGGRSAQIRLRTWAAAGDAIAARPLLGSGAGSFRTVFPAYMRPGTIDGIEGPQVVEAAHNVVLDGGVSFGLLGLAAAGFALAGAARAAFRAPADAPDRVAMVASAAAIAGGFVALNFHYITLDTGPLIAFAFGLLATAETSPVTTADPPSIAGTRTARIALGMAAAALGIAAIAYMLVTVADVSYGRGLALASGGAPWATARGPLERAVRLAPWEPRFAEGVGTAAAVTISRGFDERVYAEGRAGFARTLELKPGDAYTLAGDANLVLLAANLGRQTRLYPEALARHQEAAAADPANGLPLAGAASCLAGMGRWNEAAASYERALQLSPRYVLAWDNIAIAYSNLGRSADADAAKKRADSLRKASR